jgi:hypothetical protein
MRSSPQAPPDQRHTVQALTGGQLTPDDSIQMLRDALTNQQDRRHWILEHWPHIVESNEIDTGLVAPTTLAIVEPEVTNAAIDFIPEPAFTVEID